MAAHTAVGAVAPLQELTGGEYPGLLREVAIDDVDRVGQPVPIHGAHIPGLAVIGNGAASATEMADPPMSELDEVVDDSADTAPVGCAHHVDRRARHASADDDDRRLVAEFGQRRIREFWAEQDERLAAEVQQCVDDGRLTVGRRHRTEYHLVPVSIGFGDDVLDQFGVKGVANIGHNADEV